MTNNRWTPGRDKILRDMIAAGESSSQIAAHLGGLSRNSVIGRAHRLKLKFKGQRATSRSRPLPDPAPRPAPKPKAKARPAVKAAKPKKEAPPPQNLPLPTSAYSFEPLPGSSPILLANLSSSSCSWPVGKAQGVSQLFCGEPVARQRYCRVHAFLAFRPSLPTLKENAHGSRPGR
jgi:GcrA cell cycle regulator